MKIVFVLLVACLGLDGRTLVASVDVVPATEWMMKRASEANSVIRRVIEEAKPTIGVPYVWGGTKLQKGIDCSNYTWQLYRSAGFNYERFLGTMVMSRLQDSYGLRTVSFEEAVPGDLLVYGYRDASNKWHGHVVILVDKDGSLTGRKGLMLGAHGRPVNAVQFVTSDGFEKGYFKQPKMKLCNVLRVESRR
ncbi:MAG: NlpC/P60 family protein [Verrucomicrobiota bacterium]